MTSAVIPRCTQPMKTAISVPDATYSRVDKKAAELGVSRSQFYSIAAERYLRELEREDLTSRINDVLARSGEATHAEALEFAELSRQHLSRLLEDDEW